MAEDLVRQLGFLTLGTRLRRIGERLQAHAQQIFQSEGIDIAAALVPTLRTLHRDGESTIGGIAESLGVAQPGITRNVAQLENLGLVRAVKRGGDQRVRIITLTPKGKAVMERTISIVEPRIVAAVADICERLDGPLLDQLAGLEEALAAKPLERRAPKRQEMADD